MLPVEQMTRSVVRYHSGRGCCPDLEINRCQQLAYVSHSRTKCLSFSCEGFVVGKQVSVSEQHCAASSGIRDNRGIVRSSECLNVHPGQTSCALEVSRVSMKSSTANLFFWNLHCKIVR